MYAVYLLDDGIHGDHYDLSVEVYDRLRELERAIQRRSTSSSSMESALMNGQKTLPSSQRTAEEDIRRKQELQQKPTCAILSQTLKRDRLRRTT